MKWTGYLQIDAISYAAKLDAIFLPTLRTEWLKLLAEDGEPAVADVQREAMKIRLLQNRDAGALHAQDRGRLLHFTQLPEQVEFWIKAKYGMYHVHSSIQQEMNWICYYIFSIAPHLTPSYPIIPATMIIHSQAKEIIQNVCSQKSH